MSGLTRGQIRTQVRALLDQTDTTNSRFTDNDLNDYIDQAVNYTSTQIEYPRDIISIQAENSVGAYTLPTDNLIILTAYFGDKNITGDIAPLKITSQEALKSLYPGWLDETSATNSRPSYLILLDRRTAFIYPRPDATNSASGKQLVINYVYNPAALNSDSDIPDLPVPYHSVLQLYVAHMAYFRLNSFDNSARSIAMYRDKIKELKAAVIKETTEGFVFEWTYNPGLDTEGSGGELY